MWPGATEGWKPQLVREGERASVSERTEAAGAYDTPRRKKATPRARSRPKQRTADRRTPRGARADRTDEAADRVRYASTRASSDVFKGDSQTGVAPGGTRGRKMRSKCR